MRKRSTIILLLILAIVSNTVPRFLSINPPREVNEHLINGVKYYTSTINIPYEEYEKYCFNRYLYYSGQALSLLLILMAGYFRGKDKVVDIVFELTLWLAVSNLMDELFFDPIHLGWNEIVFAILMIIYAFQQYRQYKKYNFDHIGEHKF